MLLKFREFYKIWFIYNFKLCWENVYIYIDIYLFFVNCIFICYYMFSYKYRINVYVMYLIL